MSAFETLYWLSVADNLREAANGICLFSTLIYLVYALVKLFLGDGKPTKKITVLYAVVFSICLLLSTLLPNNSTFRHYKYELGEKAAIEQQMNERR